MYNETGSVTEDIVFETCGRCLMWHTKRKLSQRYSLRWRKAVRRKVIKGKEVSDSVLSLFINLINEEGVEEVYIGLYTIQVRITDKKTKNRIFNNINEKICNTLFSGKKCVISIRRME